ncbi:DUF2860 family protein [Vibrio gangliei]|uniref:DUF2860 family protein n=1 Tax=Vibrio gangliei TaxID=2077090 RepID=UPI000D015ABF|nr:DUF2860 family protein [Vibrio gangliei]
MKVRMACLCMMMSTAFVAHAQENTQDNLQGNGQTQSQQAGKWEEGFSGSAMLLFGVTQSNSQADSGDDTIGSLDEDGEKQTEGFVFPIASSDLSYTFTGGNHQVFIGTSNADIALGRPHLQVGYGQHIDQVGTIKLSYIPGLISSTTWQDPFLVGSKRHETDRTIKGARLQFSEILDTGLGLEFAAGKNEIDDELSGSQYSSQVQSQLDREGDLYYGELYYVTPVTETALIRSSFSYLRNQANGDAMASNQYTGQIALFQRYQQSTLTLSLKYQYAKFDESHPLFDKVQENDAVGLLATYTYDDIFGWQGVGVGVLAGFTEHLSNIDFYQYESWILGTGIRYVF